MMASSQDRWPVADSNTNTSSLTMQSRDENEGGPSDLQRRVHTVPYTSPAGLQLLPTSIELPGHQYVQFEDAWSPTEHCLSQMRAVHNEIRSIFSPEISPLTDEDNVTSSDQGVPLMMHHQPLTRINPVRQRMGLGKWLIAGLIAVAYFAHTIVHGFFQVQAQDKDPEIDRFTRLASCAEKLSSLGLECSKSDSSQCKALRWFLGPGSIIDLEETCSWDTDFGMLYALVIVRESLGVLDASWNSERQVQEASDVCHWTRIHCSNGQVTGLFLNHCNLTGALPVELTGLAHLREFEVYSNQGLAGSIPTEIGRMTSLESLELQHTSLGGTVPSEIGRLTALKELLVDATLLTGEVPKEVCNLRNGELESLHATCRGDHALLHCSCCSSCKT